MGIHLNAPSHVLDKDRTILADLIKKNPSFSTDEIYKQCNGDLPFLFKIQSVGLFKHILINN
jgi:mannose-6-phosphate isomerase